MKEEAGARRGKKENDTQGREVSIEKTKRDGDTPAALAEIAGGGSIVDTERGRISLISLIKLLIICDALHASASAREA